jgi:hypothetical protein
MFQLTDKETKSLIFQSGRSKGRGGRRHPGSQIHRFQVRV